MSKKPKQEAGADASAPNIQYVGKRQKLDKQKLKMTTVPKEVPAFIMDGKEKIELPAGIENGIFMPPETAARLFALRPDDFKTPVIKSAKKPVEAAVGQASEAAPADKQTEETGMEENE